MATGPRLTIDIADKRYPGAPQPLFAGVKLVVEPGTTLAVVGPSGVGKSSLLRMIAGIDKSYSGSIHVGDDSAAKAPPPGFVFQDARLLPWLTAVQNITELSPGVSRATALHLLDRVGLSSVSEAYPHQLSGGMQRRVALARALAASSGLLLLDEPFVSLDRDLLRDMQRLVRSLIAESGATAVLVTHVIDDAVRLADRAVTLQGCPAILGADIRFDVPPAERTQVDLGRYAGLMAEAD